MPDDGPPVVSVCYVPFFADRAEEIEPVAREACAEAGVPDATLEYWKRTVLLNDCPLFKKNRAAYICKAGVAPASPAGNADTNAAGSPD